MRALTALLGATAKLLKLILRALAPPRHAGARVPRLLQWLQCDPARKLPNLSRGPAFLNRLSSKLSQFAQQRVA